MDSDGKVQSICDDYNVDDILNNLDNDLDNEFDREFNEENDQNLAEIPYSSEELSLHEHGALAKTPPRDPHYPLSIAILTDSNESGGNSEGMKHSLPKGGIENNNLEKLKCEKCFQLKKENKKLTKELSITIKKYKYLKKKIAKNNTPVPLPPSPSPSPSQFSSSPEGYRPPFDLCLRQRRRLREEPFTVPFIPQHTMNMMWSQPTHNQYQIPTNAHQVFSTMYLPTLRL